MDPSDLSAAMVPRRASPTFSREVRAMFGRIVPRYSLFNHLTTGGTDLLWRPRALWEVDRLLEAPPRRILDLGSGPGDLTYLLAEHYPRARVVAMDFTPAMVRQGEEARARSRASTRVSFASADALHLPLRSGSVDLVTSAFLIRNIPPLEEAFREMARVLRPRGVVLALEITEPIPPWFRSLFHTYFDEIMPRFGALLGLAESSRYLSDSLRHFPSRDRVEEILAAAGFPEVRSRPQSLGIVTSFLGRRGPGLGAARDG